MSEEPKQEVKQEQVGEESNASANIRDEVKKLVGSGTDLSSKENKAKLAHEYEKKYNVKYQTAKNAIDKALVQSGGAEPEPKATTVTIGDVKSEVKPKPKEKSSSKQAQQPEQVKETKEELIEIDGKKYKQIRLSNGQVALQEVGQRPPMTKEIMTELFKSLHEGAFDFLASATEAMWKTEMKRPESERFRKNAELWATACEQYGISPPQMLVLVSAAASSMGLIIIPVLQSRGEVLKKKQSEKNGNTGKDQGQSK